MRALACPAPALSSGSRQKGQAKATGTSEIEVDRQTLTHELKELIVKELDLRDKSAADIDEQAPLFGEGLGLDSLDALQLAMAIEERFGVRLPEGDAARPIFASVAALAEHIEGALAA